MSSHGQEIPEIMNYLDKQDMDIIFNELLVSEMDTNQQDDNGQKILYVDAPEYNPDHISQVYDQLQPINDANQYSPHQSNSESGFGDGSSMPVSSPYQINSGLLSPTGAFSSNSYSPYSSPSSSSSLNGEIYTELKTLRVDSFSRKPFGYSTCENYPVNIMEQNLQPISINIPENTKHKYRHAKEMKIGHGGLRGEITLPPDYKTCDYRVILSVVPAHSSKQEIHPCMLHVTVMNPVSKQKRAKYRTELKEPKDWRVEIDIEKGRASYRPNYGRHAGDRFEIDCVRDGRILLGTDNLQVISNANYINNLYPSFPPVKFVAYLCNMNSHH